MIDRAQHREKHLDFSAHTFFAQSPALDSRKRIEAKRWNADAETQRREESLSSKSHGKRIPAGLKHLPRKGQSHAASGRRPEDFVVIEFMSRETVTALSVPRSPFQL
ncbi:MAG: hypothetical protein KDA89_19640 [Planctomycetaceae bacterium]|nr:hypothetical protein [Planctomycetaceae bacterium]